MIQKTRVKIISSWETSSLEENVNDALDEIERDPMVKQIDLVYKDSENTFSVMIKITYAI